MRTAMINALKAEKGHQMIGMTYTNEVKMNKTGNPYYGRVTKVVKGQFDFNASYENKVNNKIDRKGIEGEDFKSDSLRWGQWMAGQVNKLIEHKGEVYVRCYPLKDKKPTTTYFLDGKECTEQDMEYIRPYFPAKNTNSAKQESAGLNKDEQVQPLAIKVSNILRLSVDKQVFEM